MDFTPRFGISAIILENEAFFSQIDLEKDIFDVSASYLFRCNTCIVALHKKGGV